jgi:hypothetical protein
LHARQSTFGHSESADGLQEAAHDQAKAVLSSQQQQKKSDSNPCPPATANSLGWTEQSSAHQFQQSHHPQQPVNAGAVAAMPISPQMPMVAPWMAPVQQHQQPGASGTQRQVSDQYDDQNTNCDNYTRVRRM